MIRKVISFSLLLTFLAGIVFGAHVFVLEKYNNPLFDNLIIEAYLFNTFFAILVYSLILFLSTKHSNILGFVFMSSSLVKFGLFFLIFYPDFKQDGEMNRVEFLSFFIPYCISLSMETTFLIKHLNNQDLKY